MKVLPVARLVIAARGRMCLNILLGEAFLTTTPYVQFSMSRLYKLIPVFGGDYLALPDALKLCLLNIQFLFADKKHREIECVMKGLYLMIQKWFNQIRKKEINGPTAAVIRHEIDKAPMVVASGKGFVAQQIIEKAKEHEIPIQEDSVLVSNLIDMDLGDNIPPQLYSVIAEVLLMIEELEKKM